MTGVLAIGLLTTPSGAAGVVAPSADSRAQSLAALVTAPDTCPPSTKPGHGGCIPRSAGHVVYGERCRSARLAVAYFRAKTWERQAARDGELADRTPIVRGKTCRWARFSAETWQARARSARKALERWQARQRELLTNPTYAICHVFGAYCQEALRVASCESGRGIYAQNGQYLGMFQMGNYARSRYGHGYTPLAQARAAYAYFVDSGRDWSPWSCKP